MGDASRWLLWLRKMLRLQVRFHLGSIKWMRKPKSFGLCALTLIPISISMIDVVNFRFDKLISAIMAFWLINWAHWDLLFFLSFYLSLSRSLVRSLCLSAIFNFCELNNCYDVCTCECVPFFEFNDCAFCNWIAIWMACVASKYRI